MKFSNKREVKNTSKGILALSSCTCIHIGVNFEGHCYQCGYSLIMINEKSKRRDV